MQVADRVLRRGPVHRKERSEQVQAAAEERRLQAEDLLVDKKDLLSPLQLHRFTRNRSEEQGIHLPAGSLLLRVLLLHAHDQPVSVSCLLKNFTFTIF